ncbi:MAG: hypothetical protein J2P50_17055, partial [Hyphomicrobiaceae bacterium]|nr:hypothetical protein [Hyphomicrobiaceae bacterium]
KANDTIASPAPPAANTLANRPLTSPSSITLRANDTATPPEPAQRHSPPSKDWIADLWRQPN